ncbi:cytochrome b [Sphingomonas sp.]|uniref:cytochrome b n=1 Tax=Sphingomonas sp. TaxID=28214 RepID=UPI0035BBE110
MAADAGGYDGVARGFHWLIVVLVAVQFAIAWTMPEIHRGVRPDGLVGWHLSVGALILAVMLARLAWRLTHRPPSPPRDLSAPLRLLSRLTHYGLYALLLALPFLGWANASARGWPVSLFGVVPLPSLVAVASSFGHAAGDVHKALATALLVLVGLHASGAAYHALVLRDGVVRRMLPRAAARPRHR